MYGQGNYVPPKRAQVRGPLNEHPPRAPSLHFSQGISSSHSSLAPQNFPSPAYHQPFPSAAQQGHAFQILPNAAQSFIRPPQASVQQVRDCFLPGNNYYPNVAQGMQWPLNVNQTQPRGPFPGPRIPGQIPRNPEMFPPNPLLLQSQSGIPNHPQHLAGLRPIPLPFLPPPPPPPPPLTPGFLPPPPGRSSLPGQPDYVFSFPNPPLPSSPPPLSPSPPPPTSPSQSSCMDTMPYAPSCFSAGFRSNSLPLLPPPPPIPSGFLPPPPGRSIIPGQPDSVFSLPKLSLPASPPPLSPSPPPLPPPPPASTLNSSCIDTTPSYAPSSFVTGLKNNPELGPDSSLPGDVVKASAGFDTSSNTSISEDIMPDRSQNSEVRTRQELHTIVKNLACAELKFPPSPSKLANTTPDSDSDMDMEDDFTQQPREVLTATESITLKELDDHEGEHAQNKVDNFGSSDNSMPNSSRLDTHAKESPQFAVNHFPKYEASMAKASNSVTNSASSKNPLESTVGSLPTSFCDDTKQLNVSASMVGINFENFSGQVMKSASPFRHLQDYASDNSSEEDEKHFLDEISPVASALPSVGSSSMLGLIASNSFGGHLSGSFSETIVTSLQTTPSNMGTQPKLECNEKKTFSESVTAVDHLEKSKMNQEHVKNSPLKVSIQEDSLEEGILAVSAHPTEAESVKPQRVDVKVDEFGRLVRQDVGNSDSDDSSYVERRHRRRGRSWSRSHSPNDRRRRRSPRMRKNTRSRSRSWSPNKRRSVSRSPSYRRGDDFSGDRRLKDKGHLGVCFDFRQGRCYRGASCRYMHREPGNNESRRKKFNLGQEEVKRQAMQILRDEKESVISEAVVDEAKYERQREMIIQEGKPPDNKEEDVQAASSRLLDDEIHMRSIGIEDASTKYLLSPQAGDSLSEGQNTCRNGVSSGADILSSVQQSATFLDPPQMCEPPPSSCPLTQASLDIPGCHLHVKPTIGVSEFKSAYFVPDVIGKHSFVESKASSIASSNFTTLQAPMTTQLSHLVSSSYTPRQLSLFPTSQLVPTNSFVENPIAADANPSAQFPPNRLPSGNDLTQQSVLGHFLHEMSGHPQATEGQHHSYSPIPKFDQTPRLDNFKPKTAPTVTSQMNLPLAGNGPTGEFCFSWRPLQSFPPPSMYSLPGKPLMDSTMSTVSFPIDGLPTSSKQDPYSIQQHQFTSHLTDHVNASSISRYTSDLEGNGQPHLSGFSGLLDSKYSSHYNPNVSRFDQLPSSRYSLTEFKHGYDAPYSSSHALIDGQDARNLGTRPKSYLSNSNNMAEHALPPSTADQYDPLFDSIEPYSASSKKQLEHGQKDESRNESGSILRSSGSHIPLDVNDNSNKMLGSSAVTKSMTSENEEFGETADEEVNDVEFRSSSNQIDVTNMDENDVEIDQVKVPAKGRNSKDSRSMKLFKVALADFVKEVLKPSWRQGNMSKEAFKTIVKKTVEKVSSAMKGRRIPKTQDKINHYIDSSQRKLTKLVMGYVNKYVKT